MPGQFLTDAERARLTGYPSAIAEDDLVALFTLSPEDRKWVGDRRGDHNRLGFALTLCSLRWLGFCPDELVGVPVEALGYLAQQLGVSPQALARYGARAHTRTGHVAEAASCLGFRMPGESELDELGRWLVDRAMEHDRPGLLLALACERLLSLRLIRPGVTRLERMVASARQVAHAETFRLLSPMLSAERRATLDRLLVTDPTLGRTRLAWLREAATTNTPGSILAQLERLGLVRSLGAEELDLDVLNPNRVAQLAQLGRRSTPQALARAPAERRYPVLLAFLARRVVELTDEVIDGFDRFLAHCVARAGHELDEDRRALAEATNDKVVMLAELARILLDPHVADDQVRDRVWAQVPRERLAAAVEDCQRLVRPPDGGHLEYLARRYSHIRSCAPAVLRAFEFRSHRCPDHLLEAVALLRRMNATGARRVPDDAPCGFMTPRLRACVVTEAGIVRRRWELCVLWELRAALRAGNVWLSRSRRYADPETFLIDRARWPELRSQAETMLGVARSPGAELDAARAELTSRFERLELVLGRGEGVRVEDGKVVVTPIEADGASADLLALRQAIAARLPRVELAQVLIEVDTWCRFSDHLTRAGGSRSRSPHPSIQLYAVVLAHATNLGLEAMARVAGLTYRELAWCDEWYLRDETLQAATTAVVNHHYQVELAGRWGTGTLSSSDGQRFGVPVRAVNAVALPRYFGLGRGVTFYTWTSDQFSQYGTKVIPATMREATYVLDEILDNHSDLTVAEHTTDTSGYTELVFALFTLLGLQFSPRIRDLADQRLYRLDRDASGRQVDALVSGRINTALIVDHWDDLVRVAASLKMGWAPASLLITRLQGAGRSNQLTRALQEYGRLAKTIFILRYLESEDYRRRIGRQLNKGESVHALRRFLFFAHEGQVRRRHADDQNNQAACLNLVTNAVITWNTVYMTAVIDQLRRDGQTIDDECLAHLSPALYEHINPYGHYRFELHEPELLRGLRPLRDPGAPAP